MSHRFTVPAISSRILSFLSRRFSFAVVAQGRFLRTDEERVMAALSN